MTSSPALSHARVALLDALVHALHHQRELAALARAHAATPDSLMADTRTADALAAWTERLLADGVVSPGELLVMHQRAQMAAQAAARTSRRAAALAEAA
jgi:hypothetical protein